MYNLKESWLTEIVNREELILIFVNYTFVSLIFLVCFLFMLCIAHATSSPNDVLTHLMILACAFVMVNLVIANYVVKSMRLKKDMYRFI